MAAYATLIGLMGKKRVQYCKGKGQSRNIQHLPILGNSQSVWDYTKLRHYAKEGILKAGEAACTFSCPQNTSSRPEKSTSSGSTLLKWKYFTKAFWNCSFFFWKKQNSSWCSCWSSDSTESAILQEKPSLENSI